MISTLYGIKLGQTQLFTEDGKRIPVTKIAVEPCLVTRVLEGDTQGYQLAIGSTKHITKAIEGIMKKAGVEKKPRFLRQVRVKNLDEAIKAGTEITATDVFVAGDHVSVTGVSKGKGFAGVVKRHGFAGMPKTHGTSDKWRAPGSIGSTTTPGRVYKGKRMAGRMGGDRALHVQRV